MIYPRRTLNVIRRHISTTPVVILEGPRTVGKSTVLGAIAEEEQVGVIDLDEVDVRREVEADPAAYVMRPRPVLVDEHPRIPALLEHIKAQLNKDGAPGQFVLTGSASADTNRSGLNALVGRHATVPVLPLAQCEIEGRGGNVIEEAFDDPESLRQSGPSGAARESYIDRVLTGGFPLMLRSLDRADRYQRFTHYIEQSINYGVTNLTEVREQEYLQKLLYRYAAQTGQLLNIQAAAKDVGLKRGTAENYTRMLELLFLTYRLPAWKRTHRGPVSRPKLYVVDSGVAGRLLRLTRENIQDGGPFFRQQFGHLLETFVVGEILKLRSWMSEQVDIGYWRDRRGHEVDLVLEDPDRGAVLGIEIKAASRVTRDDWEGLRFLRDGIGARFRAGLVMHLGEMSYRVDERIYAMPVDGLWGGEPDTPRHGRRSSSRRPVKATGVTRDLPAGRALTATGDPLSEAVRSATVEMVRRMEIGEAAYWEVAAIPSSNVHFGDFYTAAGVAGALHTYQAWSGGNTDPIDQCVAAVHTPRRSAMGHQVPAVGALVHPLGSMVFVIPASGRTGHEHDELRVITEWARDASRFAQQVLSPYARAWTLWSAGRRLRSGRPCFYGNTSVRYGDTPPALKAVVDNPPHKGIPAGHDLDQEVVQLRASFYEWFGIPAVEVPDR